MRIIINNDTELKDWLHKHLDDINDIVLDEKDKRTIYDFEPKFPLIKVIFAIIFLFTFTFGIIAIHSVLFNGIYFESIPIFIKFNSLCILIKKKCI